VHTALFRAPALTLILSPSQRQSGEAHRYRSGAGARTMRKMSTRTLPPSTEVALWLRILHPDGELTPEVARAVLKLSFPSSDVTRMRELSAKARAGDLGPEDEVAMDDYERVGAVLSILKSKARQLLKRGRRSS
jgi:hypothetical protein